MRELALHFLDLARNCLEAGATLVEIELAEDPDAGWLSFAIRDNGRGMDEATVAAATDPFFTSRQTRRVGLGLALMQATCERCEGELEVSSRLGEGTEVRGRLRLAHLDCPPLGDMGAVMQCLACEADRVRFVYRHQVGQREFALDTETLIGILGVATLSEPQALCQVREYVNEELNRLRAEA